MNTLRDASIDALRTLLERGVAPSDALEHAAGGMATADGMWRSYATSWPEGGVRGWNTGSPWRQHWEDCIPMGAWAFGEDVFGNQLLTLSASERVVLWNHEDGHCVALEADPVLVLSTTLSHGLDWIDVYKGGWLEVGRRHQPVSPDMYLHWTTPLILGGEIADSNLSRVERESHLVGHAKLWKQVRDLPPGSMVIPKP